MSGSSSPRKDRGADTPRIAAVLFFALFATTFGARRLGFDRADEIAIVFCGSKKSLASGVPMAGVLLPAAMIVPLMIFHQMQLMICAVLARRYAAGPAGGRKLADSRSNAPNQKTVST